MYCIPFLALMYDKVVYQSVWFRPANFATQKSVKGVTFNWASWERRYLWLDK